jgi:Rod binding domain-containing protein
MDSISSIRSVPPELATAMGVPRGVHAAHEFEASLIASLLESMEKTFASVPGDPALAGSDDYNYLGTKALSSAIAAGGGFGIAALIAKSLAAHESTG